MVGLLLQITLPFLVFTGLKFLVAMNFPWPPKPSKPVRMAVFSLFNKPEPRGRCKMLKPLSFGTTLSFDRELAALLLKAVDVLVIRIVVSTGFVVGVDGDEPFFKKSSSSSIESFNVGASRLSDSALVRSASRGRLLATGAGDSLTSRDIDSLGSHRRATSLNFAFKLAFCDSSRFTSSSTRLRRFFKTSQLFVEPSFCFFILRFSFERFSYFACSSVKSLRFNVMVFVKNTTFSAKSRPLVLATNSSMSLWDNPENKDLHC